MEKLRKSPRWHFSVANLQQKSPSLKDGISYGEETISVSKGANFAIRLGVQLELPRSTIYTAVVFVYRFYLRYSLKKFHQYEVAGACVLLASKIQETSRRIQEVAAACARIATKNNSVTARDNSPILNRWVTSLMYTEEALLEGLFFEFDVPSSYDDVTRLTRTHVGADNEEVSRLATSFINDSCRTCLCVVYSSKIIAAAAFFWALKQSQTDAGDWMMKEGLDPNEVVGAINIVADMLAKIQPNDPQVYKRVELEAKRTLENAASS